MFYILKNLGIEIFFSLGTTKYDVREQKIKIDEKLIF